MKQTRAELQSAAIARADRQLEIERHEKYRRRAIKAQIEYTRRRLEQLVNEAVRYERYDLLTEEELGKAMRAKLISKIKEVK